MITWSGENVSSEIVQVINKEESGVASSVAIEAFREARDIVKV